MLEICRITSGEVHYIFFLSEIRIEKRVIRNGTFCNVVIEVKDENWRAGTGIYKVSDDCLQIEFERFLPSDPSYNIENSEVGDHHGLDIVHTSGAGMMSSVAQLWSVDQAGTHLWTPGNICFYLRRIVLFVFLNASQRKTTFCMVLSISHYTKYGKL